MNDRQLQCKGRYPVDNELTREDVVTLQLCEHAVRSGEAERDPEVAGLVDDALARLVDRHPVLCTSRLLMLVPSPKPS